LKSLVRCAYDVFSFVSRLVLSDKTNRKDVNTELTNVYVHSSNLCFDQYQIKVLNTSIELNND